MKNKFKGILSFFLSLIILFSVFPSTVYAKSLPLTKVTEMFVEYPNWLSTMKNDVTLPQTISDSSYKQSDFQGFYLTLGDKVTFDEGDTVTFIFKFYENGRYTGMNGDLYLYREGSITPWASRAINDFNRSTGELKLTTTFSNGTGDSGVYLKLVINKADVLDSTATLYIKVTSVTYQTESEQTSFFNKVGNFFTDLFAKLKAWFDSIFEWLKDIVENIKTGFSNLSSSISGFFTDLKDKLVKLFDDVGQWFIDIGDRISDFFSNLWTNISDSITDIRTSISDWWQSVVDWFHSLFVPEDGFFDDYKDKWDNWFSTHFGFIYESVQMFDSIIESLSDIKNGSSASVLTIPELKLPWNDIVILKEQKWLFSSLINKHEYLKWCYTTFHVVVSALFYFALICYGKKTLEELLADREL